MIEIILIVVISKKIAALMQEKGRSAAGYIVVFVVFWFGGEVLGGIAGAILTVINDPGALDRGGINPVVYIFALVGAAIGGTIGYLIAKSVPPIEDPRLRKLEAFDEDEDERDGNRRDHPRRRRAGGDGSFEDASDKH